MPLPELPLNIDDPTHDIQRDGERVEEDLYATHRGKKRDDVPQIADPPSGGMRYKD